MQFLKNYLSKLFYNIIKTSNKVAQILCYVKMIQCVNEGKHLIYKEIHVYTSVEDQ